MGACDSSKEQSQGLINNTGPGLVPQGVVPQPVEVTNLNPDLNTKLTGDDLIKNTLPITQNQVVQSIESNIPPVNQINSPTLGTSDLNINTSLNQNELSLNLNNRPIENIKLEQSKNLQNEPTIVNNTLVQQSAATAPLLTQSQPIITRDGVNRRMFYIVVQLPQREVDITKLYNYNCLADIEPFIKPDSIDEYDFYDDRKFLINDFLYTPFDEWHNSNKTLRVKLIRSGLNIANDIREYISQRTYLIGGLTFDKPNSFGLFIFNKLDNSTLSFDYSTNIYLLMKTVNQFSAYCNALNKLYISGGDLGNENITDSFISINLEEVEKNIFVPTQLCNLVKKRYWHSMIYIPENYIFIVGGPNELDVELYDIETNRITIDSRLNCERCEPSLILVNNKFLYTIFGFHLYDSFINTIERCNLHKRIREWEMVEFKLSNTSTISKAFFGVSYASNNIILVSDKENDNDLKPNYILAPGRGNIDTISDEGVLNSRSSRLFPEKFFIPFTPNESLSLAFKSGEPKIFVVNNDNGAINELCFKET